MQTSVVAGVYEKSVDRESAYERLQQRAKDSAAANNAAPAGTTSPDIPATQQQGGGWLSSITEVLTQRGPTGPRGGRGSDSILETAAKSAARAVASQAGRQIVRGVLGSIMGSMMGGSSSRRKGY